MVSRPLRFVHASDFRLDRPCEAVPGLPKSLLDPFVDARYRAVERLISACIERQVDALVLAGGLLDPDLTGLRGPWHLVEQFARLQEAGIDVVWCGGHVDAPHRWPAYVGVPANVRRLAPSARTPVKIRRGGTHPLTVCGVHASVGDDESFRVVVKPSAETSHCELHYDYLACGGRSEQTLEPNRPAGWSGSPQGRSHDEPGPHGAVVVTVNPDRTIEREAIACDVIRWATLDRSPADSDTLDAVVDDLTDELRTLAQTPTEAVIARVRIAGESLVAARFRSPSRREELLQRLRRAADGPTPVFVSAIETAPAPNGSRDADPSAQLTVAEPEAAVAN